MATEPWIAEAIINFLRGPLYVHPLMEFIDEKCLIFTTEEENKLEYSTVHNEFKELVDRLLTDFLEELGTKPEEFFETIAEQLNKDKFTEFVVNTILTVDDFLMFKAMMVKRNVDLTNQVLEAMEQLRKAAVLEQQQAAAEKVEEPAKGVEATGKHDEELDMALRASLSVHDAESQSHKLLRMMHALQLEDEDVALSIATAESFKESAAMQAELAELEMAVALSLALEEEQRRLAAQQAAARGTSDSSAPGSKAAPAKPAAPASSGTSAAAPPLAPAPAEAGACASKGMRATLAAAAPAAAGPQAGGAAPSSAAGGGAVSPVLSSAAEGKAGAAARPEPPKLQHRPFPEPEPADLGPLPSLAETRPVGSKRPPPAVEPLESYKVGPNQGLEKLSAVAAAAAAAASGPTPTPVQASPASTQRPQEKREGLITPDPLNLDDKLPGPAPSETPRTGRFVPAPLNLGVPTPARSSTTEASPSSSRQQDSSRSLGKFNSSFGQTHNRAAGFQSDSRASTGGSADLAAVRQAAMEAAATQKNLMSGKRAAGGGDDDESANAWLKDAKLKLVAQKKLEREKEMQAYAAEKGQKPGRKGNEEGDDLEARRAALRSRLASKFKQDLINQ